MSITYKANENYSYCNSVCNLNLESATIRDKLNEMAKKYPHKVLCIYNHLYNGLELTYFEVQRKSFTLAQNLLTLGLKKGDRLGVVLPNTYEYVIALFASAMIGVIIVPFDFDFEHSEFHHALLKIEPHAIIIYNSLMTKKYFDNNFPQINRFYKGNYISLEYPSVKNIIIVNDHENQNAYEFSKQNVYFFCELESFLLNEIQQQEFPHVDCDDIFMILFTSGTTSRCKGVTIRHYSIYNTCRLSSLFYYDQQEEIVYLQLSLPYHVTNVSLLINSLFLPNMKLVYPCLKINFQQVFESIEKYKCNYIFSMPVNMIYLMNHSLRSRYNLSSLKTLYSGGQAVSLDVVNRLKRELNLERMVLIYGMTEILIVSYLIYDLKNFNEASYQYGIGQLIPGIEYKVIDRKTGNMQSFDVEGELCVRGYNTTKEYWNEPSKTKETIDVNGWLHTGDSFRMDKHGYLFFVNRSKDIIIGKGLWRNDVYPSEVEDHLAMHPNVREVVVFGININEYEEEVCAWVKLYPGFENTTPEELIEFCKNYLAEYKIPRYIKFVNSFPSSNMGKYLKNVMKEQYKKELGLF